MSLFQWIWPSETSDEKLERWQKLYVFDYKSINSWTKLKKDDESEFVEYFKKEWAALSIDTHVNTKLRLTENQRLIGHVTKELYEENRLRILSRGFTAYQYNRLFK
jgi:hypothetical protein